MHTIININAWLKCTAVASISRASTLTRKWILMFHSWDCIHWGCPFTQEKVLTILSLQIVNCTVAYFAVWKHFAHLSTRKVVIVNRLCLFFLCSRLCHVSCTPHYSWCITTAYCPLPTAYYTAALRLSRLKLKPRWEAGCSTFSNFKLQPGPTMTLATSFKLISRASCPFGAMESFVLFPSDM